MTNGRGDRKVKPHCVMTKSVMAAILRFPQQWVLTHNCNVLWARQWTCIVALMHGATIWCVLWLGQKPWHTPTSPSFSCNSYHRSMIFVSEHFISIAFCCIHGCPFHTVGITRYQVHLSHFNVCISIIIKCNYLITLYVHM